MILLRDLLDVMFDVTEMEVTARKPEGSRIHGFYFSESNFSRLPQGTRDRIRYGETTFIPGRININGRRKKDMSSEMAYGVEFKAIPKELLDGEVSHFLDRSAQYGRHLYVEIHIQELQCETARVGLRGRAFEWLTSEEETKK